MSLSGHLPSLVAISPVVPLSIGDPDDQQAFIPRRCHVELYVEFHVDKKKAFFWL